MQADQPYGDVAITQPVLADAGLQGSASDFA
jgi:hypothetical protein